MSNFGNTIIRKTHRLLSYPATLDKTATGQRDQVTIDSVILRRDAIRPMAMSVACSGLLDHVEVETRMFPFRGVD